MSEFSSSSSGGALPVIDISALNQSGSVEAENLVVQQIGHACRHVGFFYVYNHGIDDQLIEELTTISRAFFALDVETKNSISMDKAGRAWRGFFPVGNEVTSGIPDQKEGIYFGTQLPLNDPRVIAEKPLHGQNLYYPPTRSTLATPAPNTAGDWPKVRSHLGRGMGDVVEDYMAACTALGRTLMRAIALSLKLDASHFQEQFEDPTTLFRIFNYPPHDGSKYGEASLGVGEHTDYGFITLLHQDTSVAPGEVNLEVRDLSSASKWIPAPPIRGTFVINLGDALEHCTGGLLRATPHRVRQRATATTGRLSFPFFFDPSFDADMRPLVHLLAPEDAAVVKENRRLLEVFQAEQEQKEQQCQQQQQQGGDSSVFASLRAGDVARYRRWDNQDVTQFRGTYGAYLLCKVAKVFPDLASKTDVGAAAASQQ